MDKIMFLAALAEKLSHYPLSDEDINICVAEMTRQFEAVSDEDFAKENPGDDDVAIVAEGLYKQYSAHKAAKEETLAEEAAKAEADEAQGKTEEESADEVSEGTEEENTVSAEPPLSTSTSDEDFFEALARETEEDRKDQEKLEELKRIAIGRAIAENDEIISQASSETAEEDPIVDAFDPEKRPDIAYEELKDIGEEGSEDEPLAEDIAEEDEPYELTDDSQEGLFVDEESLNKAEDNPEAIEKHKKKMKEKVKGTPMFWTIFALTLPITLPLLIAVASLFISAYVIVTALILAVSVTTVCCVAGGTVLSLIGIIYGVVELFDVVAIGLYELGLGIAIGGGTMLVSVLLYNVAIRFAPKLYGCLFKLAKLTASKIRELYYKIKKECGR